MIKCENCANTINEKGFFQVSDKFLKCMGCGQNLYDQCPYCKDGSNRGHAHIVFVNDDNAVGSPRKI